MPPVPAPPAIHPHPRYIFVAGLHRCGTSLVARMLAAHPEIAAIRGSDMPEDEGCYLQGAIPHTALHGAPGAFATDPAQHHVEGSRYDDAAVRRRLAEDWAAWFDPACPWRVEKSPVNLTRTRLYQQLFPRSQFVIVLRHPEAMAAALAKWVDRPAPALIDYALDAWDLVAEDVRHLHAVLVLRYEDVVAAPAAHARALHRFCGLSPVPFAEPVRRGNRDYAQAMRMHATQAERARRWGYRPGMEVVPAELPFAHPLHDLRDAVSDDLSDYRGL